MFTTSLISLLGCLSVRRIFSQWREKKIISAKTFLYFEFFLIAFSLLAIFFAWKSLLCAIFFLGMMFFFSLVPIFVEWRRTAQFNTLLISAMDAILLSLRAGRSFREALSELVDLQQECGYYLKEIITNILLRQNSGFKTSDARIQRAYSELKKADQSTHRIAERIKSFRYQLRVEENFRQRSRMSTLQARAQSIVIGILYLFTLAFDFLNFSRNLDIKMVAASFLLFILGSIWVWNLGKRHKWKV